MASSAKKIQSSCTLEEFQHLCRQLRSGKALQAGPEEQQSCTTALKDLVRKIDASAAVLDALILLNNTDVLQAFLDAQDFRRPTAGSDAEFRLNAFFQKPCSAEVLSMLHAYGFSLEKLAHKILLHGFEIKDPLYARLALDLGKMPLPTISELIASCTERVTEETSDLLAEFYLAAANSGPPQFPQRLLTTAWLDQSPKMMAALAWLGIPPSSYGCRDKFSQSSGHEISRFSQAFESAHDLMALRHQHPSLASLLASSLPFTYRQAEP